jgi:hypothetical protein
MTRGRLSGNARAADDAKLITSDKEARDICRGGAMGWRSTRDAVIRRDRDAGRGCSRCGGAVRWDLPGNDKSGLGPSVDHRATQVADCVGLTRGAARRLLHDMTPGALQISHWRCNSRDGRGFDRPPEPSTEPIRVLPVVEVTRVRTPKNGFVRPDGSVIYRGPNYGPKEYEAECAQFAEYRRQHEEECKKLGKSPYLLERSAA